LALSGHQIAHSCQISRSTVADYLDRFEKAGLGWPLPEDLSEERTHGVDGVASLQAVEKLGYASEREVIHRVQMENHSAKIMIES
jgi:hypothetical protein